MDLPDFWKGHNTYSWRNSHLNRLFSDNRARNRHCSVLVPENWSGCRCSRWTQAEWWLNGYLHCGRTLWPFRLFSCIPISYGTCKRISLTWERRLSHKMMMMMMRNIMKKLRNANKNLRITKKLRNTKKQLKNTNKLRNMKK